MNFGQLIEYNNRNSENEAGRLVSRHLFVLSKALYKVKSSCFQLSFNIFQYPSTWITTKENVIKF